MADTNMSDMSRSLLRDKDIYTISSASTETGYKPTPKVPKRKGEIAWFRWLLRNWAPIIHTVACITLATLLIAIIDGIQAQPRERETYMTIFTDRALRSSDVTTLISAFLVLTRVLSQCFVASLTWECALILLQHDGLSLDQLTLLISYKFPTAWSGKHAWPVGIVLLLMLPSMFTAPLLSGSVNWGTASAYDIPQPYTSGFGIVVGLESSNWNWFKTNPHGRFPRVIQAFGRATAAYLNESATPPASEDLEAHPRYRLIAKQPAPPKTRVRNIPIPYIAIQSISWNDPIETWVYDLVRFQNRLFYTNDGIHRNQSFTIGNAVLFGEDINFPKTELNLLPGTIYQAIKKVAVLVGKDNVNEGKESLNYSCNSDKFLPEHRSRWDHADTLTMVSAQWGNCWALGTVRFLAGIKYFKEAKYISNAVIEALANDSGKVIGDNWAEYTTFLLSDVMSIFPITRPVEHASGNLTAYTEELMLQSYVSVRSVLQEYSPDSSEEESTFEMPLEYLQAKVDRRRVMAWVILNLLLPLSWVLIGILKMVAGAPGMRNPVAEPTLVPLLMDVREILAGDTHGMTNMSYLTARDSEAVGKMKLQPMDLDTPNMETVFGLNRVYKD